MRYTFIDSRSPERGSIFNLTDDEISFPFRRGISLHTKGPSSADVNNAPTQSTSTRTTRSRTRVDHSVPIEKSKVTGGPHSTHTHPPLDNNKSENVDTDEDNDELDLIGSSAFSEEGMREARPEAGNIVRRAGLPGARVIQEVPMSIDKRSSIPAEEMDVDEQEDPLKRQEPIRDKDDATDAEEVDAITKPGDAEVTGHVSPIEDKLDTSSVPECVPSQPAQGSPSLLSVASPVQAASASIQQATPSPLPSQADDKLTQLGVSESGTQKMIPNAPLDNYRFNPSYTLPPLNVLPSDFTKKAKPIKRRKEKDREKERDKERESKRDKDDNVPMGLSRWAATLMANPLWRKVARANKTLSTHDWSVRISFLSFHYSYLFIRLQ